MPAPVWTSCTLHIGRVAEAMIKQEGQPDNAAVILAQDVIREERCHVCGGPGTWSIRTLVRS